MKSLAALAKGKFAGQTCLLRVDFNIKSPHDLFKIERTIPTIKFLLSRRIRIVLVSHRGRPRRADRDKRAFSLRVFMPILARQLRRKIVFLMDIPAQLPAGEIFLIENIRFFSGEKENHPTLAKRLSALGDFYVNEAFAVSHRAAASLVAITRYLPAYAGLLLSEEIRHLSRILKRPKRPLVIIFGGAKVADKAQAIKNLLPKAQAILVGSSAINRADLGIRSSKLIRPIDWLSDRGKALDIGPMTIKFFCEQISRAGTIVWSGPLGQFEDERFAQGSIAIARAMASASAFSLAGGGETTQLIEQLGLEKKFSFLSTGGGAMLQFLAGKKLPGLAALERVEKIKP